jgi:hypothetical protein
VVHVCNPNYSGGRDQLDCSSKPDWANCSGDPISKIPIRKSWTDGCLKVWALSSSPSIAKKKKKKKKKKQRQIISVADGMVLYVENPKDSTKIVLELIKRFSKAVRYKINFLKISYFFSSLPVDNSKIKLRKQFYFD